MKILDHTNHGLALPCKFALAGDVHTLQDMEKAMKDVLIKKKVGVAIAANQLFDNTDGSILSCFYTGPRFPKAAYRNKLFVNPSLSLTKEVLAAEGRFELGAEVCLSHPKGHYVLREKTVVLDYYELVRGKLVKQQALFTGFAARIIQHEVDHLVGVGIWTNTVPFLLN